MLLKVSVGIVWDGGVFNGLKVFQEREDCDLKVKKVMVIDEVFGRSWND
jgi:hypothetical protein